MTRITEIGLDDGPPSDPAGPARLVHVPPMTKVDRIDDRGNIREHFTRDGLRTICGVEIGRRQPPCGNRPCKRCEKIAARLSDRDACGVKGSSR